MASPSISRGFTYDPMVRHSAQSNGFNLFLNIQIGELRFCNDSEEFLKTNLLKTNAKSEGKQCEAMKGN